jgi:hypothetical protein
VSYHATGLELLRGRGGIGGPAAAGRIAWWALLGLAGAHWVTLSNRRRVMLDESGRVAAGLPDTYQGVDVRDIAPLSRKLRALEASEQECRAEVTAPRAKTFPSASQAAKALVAANPELAQLLESDCSHDCVAYRHWLNRGRRGPKPAPSPGDGRFDPLNERLELHGRRKVGSWLEAVHVTVPPSRRWSDFRDRLPALEEATGLRLELPEAAEALERADVDRQACADRTDLEMRELVGTARAGRLADAEEAIPF